MAYKVMYRTYRPQTFSEVVGQQVIIKTLKNSILQNKISHAYLFCGPRGTGKTTLARIFAKALNCGNSNNEELLCNECDSCKRITNGDHPDVIEIDAASNSGVDAVRDIIDQVNYHPMLGKKKVYIIDEVHNMSNAAFNALLKTLEEPPEYVVFILCTTEPNKLLPTILSRVQRFDFSKVSNKDLIFNMQKILKNEKMEFDIEALNEIANLSDGGVRDSLSLLDQVMSYVSNKITLKDVNKLFGLLSVEEKLKYVNYINDYNLKSCLEKLNEDYDNGIDLLKLYDDLTHIYKDFLIYTLTKDESLFTILNKDSYNKIKITKQQANSILKTLIDYKQNFKQSNSIFDCFELLLINLCTDSSTNVTSSTNSNISTNSTITNTKEEPLELNNSQTKATNNSFTNHNLQTDTSTNNQDQITQTNLNTQKEAKKQYKTSNSNLIKYDKNLILKLMHNNNKQTRDSLVIEFKKIFDDKNFINLISPIISDLEASLPILYSLNTVVLKTNDPQTQTTLNLEENQSILTSTFSKLTNTNITNVITILNTDFENYANQYIKLKKENNLSQFNNNTEKSNSDLFLQEMLGNNK